MKVIYLNALLTVPTEEAEERIQKNKGSTTIKDGHTPSRQWFIEQGLTPPKDAKNEEIERDEYGNIILDDHEIEEVPVPLSIPLNNLGSWVADIDGGSVVYTKSNIAYNVIEDVYEIDTYIEYITMSWWRRQLLAFKSFFARKQKVKTN